MRRLISLLFVSIIIFGFTGCVQKSYEDKVQSMAQKDPLEAVKKNWYSIRYIQNPTEEMQLEAVRQYGESIEYIKNPTQKVQLEAVKQDKGAIRHINNPNEEVQLEALKRWNTIYYIKNPTQKVALEAFKTDKRAIRHINNPTEEMQLEVVRQDGNAIFQIKNPTQKVQLEAVRQYGYAIRYIKNPSEVLKIEASKNVKNLKTKYKIRDYTLADKNIRIEIINDNKFSISNLTNNFIYINILSFYYGEYGGKDINSIGNINLPPKSNQEISFYGSFGSEEATYKNGPKVDFGFTVNYMLNGKNIDVYGVNKYFISEFIK